MFYLLDNRYDDDTKAVINEQNKDGMALIIIGFFIILFIAIIYKKKKIKL